MAKQSALAQEEKKMPKRKLVRKLERARSSQQRAERKVGKLRTRLEQAEAKLAQRTVRVSMAQERLVPPMDVAGTAAGQDNGTVPDSATPILLSAASGDPDAIQASSEAHAAVADAAAAPAPGRSRARAAKGAHRSGTRSRGNSFGTTPAPSQ